MIRRDTTTGDGSPAWVLISQIEHARLAGDLAAHWGSPPFGRLQPREVVLPAIYRHDDGWADWERRPTIDPATGRPRSFTEMPNHAAHDIWRQSIDSVADLGPLAQFMVAEHFTRLRRSGDEANEPEVAEFLAEFEVRCRQWLAAWQAEDPAANTSDVAQAAVAHLQLFDALSLTLCCRECIGAKPLTTPLGHTLQLHFHRDHVSVAPWPWTTDEFAVGVAGRLLPVQSLHSNEQLRRRVSTAPQMEIAWRLRPGE